MSRTAVLLMSYGTPERLEDVEPYYTHIRRGSRPPPEVLDELVARYRAIGGPTALNRITREQAGGLAAELAARGRRVPVYVGFKHVAPFLGDAVRELEADGVERVVGLVLAPHYSLRSVAEYEAYVEAARPAGMAIDVIESWHDHAGLVEWLAARLTEALGRLEDAKPLVVFTAHSVPARVVERGDPYPDQLHETAGLVARRAGVERWRLAYQSAGRTAETWLDPDVIEVIGEAAGDGFTTIVVQPIGFVADHLEVLYDLDIEARQAAESCGMGYARAAMPNAHPAFIAVLADLVEERIRRKGW